MDTASVVRALGDVELFGSLDQPLLQELAARVGTQDRHVPRGATVFVQGERSDRMYLLAQGAVRIFFRSQDGRVIELVRHRPPAVFGEIALLDGGERTATAEAIEDSLLLPIPREELLRLLQSRADVLDALLRTLGRMVRRTTRQLTDLVFLDLEGRVARQLLLLAHAGPGGGLRTGRLTQTELAERVGGARQSVNRKLRSLEERGHIRSVGLDVEILDEEALRRRARG
jgi:CRP-like cAMP-binding protein